MATKKTTTKTKAILTLEEAADHLGITPEALMRSRGRGLEPGKSGFKKAGVLVWNRKDLPKGSEVGVTSAPAQEAEGADDSGGE